ncbi:MAG: hypothetical protein ACI4AX_02845, partial [Muribaculaceae bacterium]
PTNWWSGFFFDIDARVKTLAPYSKTLAPYSKPLLQTQKPLLHTPNPCSILKNPRSILKNPRSILVQAKKRAAAFAAALCVARVKTLAP